MYLSEYMLLSSPKFSCSNHHYIQFAINSLKDDSNPLQQFPHRKVFLLICPITKMATIYDTKANLLFELNLIYIFTAFHTLLFLSALCVFSFFFIFFWGGGL